MSTRRAFLASAFICALLEGSARSSSVPTPSAFLMSSTSSAAPETSEPSSTRAARPTLEPSAAGNPRSHADVELEQTKDVIRCRLLEIGNWPLPDVLFAATREGVDPELFPMAAWAFTDADGRCRMEVEPGSYWVSFTPREFAGNAFLTRQPKAGVQRTEILFMPGGSIPAKLFWIRGSVKNSDGSPAKDAWVHAVRQSDKAVFHARTDGDRFGFWVDNDESSDDDSFHVFANEPGFRSKVQVMAKSTATEFVLEPVQDSNLSPSEAVAAELAQHAAKLKTIEPGSGFDDMRSMKDIVDGAHVVSLGDATSGARDASKLARRMIEYCVSELSFSVLAIEAGWAEARAANEFVLHGTGDAKSAVAALRVSAADEPELLEVVRWMRAWNEDEKHARKVELAGIDVQSTSIACRQLLDYLNRVDEESAERASLVLAAYRQSDDRGRPRYMSLSSELKGAAHTAIQEVLSLLEDSKEIYVKRSSDAEWRIAKQCAVILSQADDMLRRDDPQEARDSRERSMAENVRWILGEQPPGARIVVWTKSEHARDHRDGEHRSMGSHLREKLGAELVIVGIVSGIGLEKIAPVVIVDLRRLPKDSAAAKWASTTASGYDALASVAPAK
jgi:erythromycin esterase